MLQEKRINYEGKVIAIKLISGEEIIAKCIQHEFDKSNLIRIQQPLTLVIGQLRQSNGQTQVSFSPWMISLKPLEIVSLKLDHVLFIGEAGEVASNQYTAAIATKT